MRGSKRRAMVLVSSLALVAAPAAVAGAADDAPPGSGLSAAVAPTIAVRPVAPGRADPRQVTVRVSCDLGCRITAAGTADPRGRAGARRLQGAAASLDAAGATTVTLAVPAALRAALARAGGGIAKVQVTATDLSGNAATARTVAVRLGR